MGLVDSGVLIAAEREVKPVSELLARLEHAHGQTEIVLSAITSLILKHLPVPNTTNCERQANGAGDKPLVPDRA